MVVWVSNKRIFFKTCTFFIVSTKDSADPIAETHKTSVLQMSIKANLWDMLRALRKYKGANLLKNIGREFFTVRISDAMASTSFSETCVTQAY